MNKLKQKKDVIICIACILFLFITTSVSLKIRENHLTSMAVSEQETIAQNVYDENAVQKDDSEYQPLEDLPDVMVIEDEEDYEDIDPQYSPMSGIEQKVVPFPSEKYRGSSEDEWLSYGIDVSHWNGDIDWAAVKAAGVEFAIIKVGGRSIDDNGKIYLDNCFDANMKGAIENDIAVGVYFFSQAVTEQEAIEEASVTLSQIKKYAGQIDYPIVFDWEDGDNYRGTKANLNSSQITSITKAFCATIQNGGYVPAFYGSPGTTVGLKAAPNLSDTYLFWLAHYTNSLDKKSTYKGSYQIWQYSETGTVSGISDRKVDLNVAYFGEAYGTSISLNLPQTEFSINPGDYVDFLSSVTATDSFGRDISSKVTYSIMDADGNALDENSVKQSAGNYTITYSVTDFSKYTKTATASLSVRTNPILTTGFDTMTANDMMSESEILSLLQSNVYAMDCYKTNLNDRVMISGYSNSVGTHTITYSVTDNFGLTSSKTIKLVVEYAKPSISLSASLITVRLRTPVKLMNYINATDYNGNTLAGSNISVTMVNPYGNTQTMTGNSEITFTICGTYTLSFVATDSSGRSTTASHTLVIDVVNQ